MLGAANVTVTVREAFAVSFRSVSQEADCGLKGFGKRASRSMKAADWTTAGLGKSMAGIGQVAKGPHIAIGATARELQGLKYGATHVATATREMQNLTQESRRAARAAKADRLSCDEDEGPGHP